MYFGIDIKLIFTKQSQLKLNKMKESKKTYKIVDVYPPYDVEEWINVYKRMFEMCIVNKNDNHTFETLKPYMIQIKKFLKSKGQKFI